MSFELAPGTLLNNRYQIKKVVTFSADGGVYVARDMKVTDKNWIIKEMIPSPQLDEETLAKRHAAFTEAVEAAMQFDHPNIPRILDTFSESRREYVVMEHVDGVSLQVLSDMSVNPLPESQVLSWGQQICDAIAYLHNRPRPFIFAALEPSHVILTPDEKIKLINFGLDRFFGPGDPPVVFADDPREVKKDFVRFGETLCQLLTKTKPTALGLPREAGVTPQTERVVNLLLEGETQETYRNFDDIRAALEVALHPPPEPKAEPTPGPARAAKTVTIPMGEPGAPSAVQSAIGGAVTAFLSQRIAVVAAEVAALLALIVGIYWWTHPGINYHKTGPTAYVALGTHDVAAVQIAERKVVDRITPVATVGDVAVSGSWLFISDSSADRILRFDTETDRAPEKGAQIRVDRNPACMIVDEMGRSLFIAHPSTHNVSRVDLTRDPPQMESVLAVGSVPHALAASSKGDLLFVANAKDQTVAVVETQTSKTVGTVKIPGTPWGMAVAPEASGLGQLWVCVQDPDAVLVVDIATLEIKETISDLMGGSKPISALFSVDGSKVYVTMEGSSSVVVFDSAKMAAAKAITVGASPQRTLYTPSLTQLWTICKSASTTVSVIDPTSDAVVGQIAVGNAAGPAAMAR